MEWIKGASKAEDDLHLSCRGKFWFISSSDDWPVTTLTPGPGHCAACQHVSFQLGAAAKILNFKIFLPKCFISVQNIFLIYKSCQTFALEIDTDRAIWQKTKLAPFLPIPTNSKLKRLRFSVFSHFTWCTKPCTGEGSEAQSVWPDPINCDSGCRWDRTCGIPCYRPTPSCHSNW